MTILCYCWMNLDGKVKKKKKAWFILEQLIIKIKTVVYLLSLIGGIFIHKHGQLFVKQ